MEGEQIAVQLENHENRIVGAEHRIKDLEQFQKNQNDLIISVNELAINMKNMMQEQILQGKRLEKLELEPAKQWTSTKKAFFNAFLGAIGTSVAGGIMYLFWFVSNSMH